MFDIGFSELFLIAVVGLIVIGPERLPKVARTLGHLFGRMQRYVAEVKSDINREMELDELRKLQSSMQEAARDIEQGVSTQVNFIESEVKQAGDDATKAVESAASQTTGVNLLGTQSQPDPAEKGPEVQTAEEKTPQLELSLDREPSAPAEKQA